MPFIDGYKATREIRKLYMNMDVQRELQPKICAVTGHVENEYVQKAYSSGMDKVYSKPFAIKEFGHLLLNMRLIETVPDHLRFDSDDE